LLKSTGCTVVTKTIKPQLVTDGSNEVFLHKKEATKAYEDNESIDVFLYVDNMNRITASTKEPLVTLGKAAMLEVVEIKPKYGVFLFYGMVKDLLLSLDDLPYSHSKWPQVNDKVIVEMIEKNGQLFAHIIGRKQVAHHFHEKTVLEEKSEVDAYVMYLIDNGMVCFTEDGNEIFIHRNNYREEFRIGQAVRPRILKKNPDGEYVGTLIEQKELMLEKDAIEILEYLESHEGIMPFTDKTDPETISELFHMSKSAFKRALGSLYKAKKVELNERNTKIIK